MSENINCKNCGSELKSYYKHCPECGQKVHDNLTLGVLFSNTISNYFSVDARFFRSFIPLMFRPGYLARKFVEGKRLMYLHPAQYYLFMSVVFFFIFSFNIREGERELDKAMHSENNIFTIQDSIPEEIVLDTTDIKNILKPLKENNVVVGIDDEEMKVLDSVLKSGPIKTSDYNSFQFKQKTVDSLISVGAPDNLVYKEMGMRDDANKWEQRFFAQILKFYKNRLGGFLGALNDTVPISMFILLPIFALLLKIFYFRSGRYSHHLVFGFYFFSFLFMVFSLILLVNHIVDIPGWIDTLLVFSTFIYLFLALKHFYRQGYIVSFIKSNIIVFVYSFLFVIPIAIMIMLLTAYWFY